LALLYVAACGGIWLGGYTVRVRRIYVAGLEERAATLERERQHLARIAVADERAAIARELHDVVAHSLAVMIVQADGGRYAFENEPERAREALTTVADTGRAALEDMRRLVGVLRGTGTEPEPDRGWATIEQLDTLVERARSAGLTVEVRTSGVAPPLSAAVELAVHRIVQEALTNVLRHAAEPRAEVRVDVADGALVVAVINAAREAGAGAGPRADGATASAVVEGAGMRGMRERAAAVGGKVTAGPDDGGCQWRVRAELPLARTAGHTRTPTAAR
jgi:signal transduction histidine kinase